MDSTKPSEKKPNEDDLVIDASKVDNAVLKRLIEEVRLDEKGNRLHGYNRTHNRHNRGGQMIRP